MLILLLEITLLYPIKEGKCEIRRAHNELDPLGGADDVLIRVNELIYFDRRVKGHR